jgi:phospholipid/cholesterol/gamma-HCH transport system permease protein
LKQKLSLKLDYKLVGNKLLIKLTSELNEDTVSYLWRDFDLICQTSKFESIEINAEECSYCNGIGIALLYNWRQYSEKHNITFQLSNLKNEFDTLYQNFASSQLKHQISINDDKYSSFEAIGRRLEVQLKLIQSTIEFIGESFLAFLFFLKNPIKNVRWKEVLSISESSGLNALPIILLIGFLLGLIMSFQSAIPMQKFGAEIYVANLVGLSLFRELGPLMTAIILAGRSGSSFAAEIGTMKVSEELDALNTMGLNPIHFLILPRMISGMIVSPILTIFLNLSGLIGSLLVLLSLGYPTVTFFKQISNTVKITDLFSGLFKSIVFGLLIAGIGCLSGMNTKEGASAVGESTTKAVVNGIIIISVVDGVFSVIFYYLGI